MEYNAIQCIRSQDYAMEGYTPGELAKHTAGIMVLLANTHSGNKGFVSIQPRRRQVHGPHNRVVDWWVQGRLHRAEGPAVRDLQRAHVPLVEQGEGARCVQGVEANRLSRAE